MTVAFENQPHWLVTIEKLEGLNEIKPFYTCPKFWSSPFRLRCWTKDSKIEIGQQELGDGLAILETKFPGTILRIAADTYDVRDANRFAQAAILGTINE